MKKIKKLSLLCLSLLGMIVLLGNQKLMPITYYEYVPIGIVEESNTSLIYSQHIYPLFSIKGGEYIALSHLFEMGIVSQERNNVLYLSVSNENTNAHQILLKDEMAYMHPYPVYCGNMRSYVLEVKDELLVPLNSLYGFWQIDAYQGALMASSRIMSELDLVEMNEDAIINHGDFPISLQLVNLFYKEKQLKKESKEFVLEPGEIYSRTDLIKEDALYVTTSLRSSMTFKESLVADQEQAILQFFSHYDEEVRKEELGKLFPRYCIKAKMKYAVGSLKAQEIVEIWRAEKKAYYVVKNNKDKKIQVPHDSVQIVGACHGNGSKVRIEDIEDYLMYSRLTSTTPYFIWTDVQRQRIYVLQQEGTRWRFIKQFICSTGRDNNPTPTGLYQVQYTFPYFGEEKGYRCKNVLVFYRDYMFHSILFDKTGKYIRSGQYELGQRVSHGCVRLSEKDSEWLYKHIPVGTTVWIR